MDHSGILIVDLAKGRLGEDKATLVGKLLMMKLVLTGYCRVDTPEEQRRTSRSSRMKCKRFAPLSWRKRFRSCGNSTPLTLVISILDKFLRRCCAALQGNFGTLICFTRGCRMMPHCWKVSLPRSSPVSDLINLGRGQAYVRLACEGQTSRPFRHPHASVSDRRRPTSSGVRRLCRPHASASAGQGKWWSVGSRLVRRAGNASTDTIATTIATALPCQGCGQRALIFPSFMLCSPGKSVSSFPYQLFAKYIKFL